jgi:hypothetical protein
MCGGAQGFGGQYQTGGVNNYRPRPQQPMTGGVNNYQQRPGTPGFQQPQTGGENIVQPRMNPMRMGPNGPGHMPMTGSPNGQPEVFPQRPMQPMTGSPNGQPEVFPQRPMQPFTGGLNQFQPRPAYQPPTQPLLREQTVQDPAFAAGGVDQYGYALAGKPPSLGPQPQTTFQPGQGGWHIGGGVQQGDGGRSPQSWQPSFMPGQNEYLTHIMNNYLSPQQRGQINPNDQIGSVGQMSGIPFDPSRWSY